MKITIPDFCLVLLIGVAGSGKTTFAKTHFAESEIVSEDAIGLEGQAASAMIREVVEARLRRRCLTVVDASNILRKERAPLLRIAKAHYTQAVAIVLQPGKHELATAARAKPIRHQVSALRRSLKRIADEGFLKVYHLQSRAEMAAARIERKRLSTDLRDDHGPFDIVGDVHGCVDELTALLAKLGYDVQITGAGEQRRVSSRTPRGRRAVFVGDLVDRGPASPDVLRIVMHMRHEGQALAVPGNHDVKLLRWLKGSEVRATHGFTQTASQFEREPAGFRSEVRDFIEGLASHAWLDGGRLAVAHAGIKEEMIGRVSGRIREFCLYGETSGEIDEFGLPIRYHWAAEYRGGTAVIYGHTPVPEAEWLNNTLCIDTGCVFGGKLTALRWPEREIVSVPAERAYADTVRPFAHPPLRPGYTEASSR